MNALAQAIDDLREFVNNHFDGSTSRCLELDELLWRVRLANQHEPEMRAPRDLLEDLDL